ncbi:MAG TPA: anaerobic sulfatase maturase [Candidatus Deferrimicrobium sp.]|nr:anaerobic sulfatase maturase [Candidatus Deferrimicrobium sp.]
MTSPNKPFSLLIKPASADCNQHCAYCFYLNHAKHYLHQRRRMSLKTLKRIISNYLKTQQPQYVFTWQGGEPTLMGIDFYKQAVKFQREYAAPGAVVVNGLQTNALLIDNPFAEFFARHHFLLGVSLDGPAYIHDQYRKHKNGTGSYQKVRRGIDYLVRNAVEFNILTLISRANVKKGKEVYQFLCEQGFNYHQYIECVEFDTRGRPLPYTITGEEWGNFLCEIFDEWIKSGIYRVSIRLFDAILSHMVQNRYTVCSMGPSCGQYFVVEYNGDIYPCDFFVRDNLKLGNIEKDSWLDLLSSPVLANFAAQKNKWHNRCAQCEYLEFCCGDCLKNRFYTQTNPAQLSWLCKGWQIFYQHTLPSFRDLAEKIRQSRENII